MKTDLLSAWASQNLINLFRLCSVLRWMLLIFWVLQIAFFVLCWTFPEPMKLGPMDVHFDPQVLPPGASHQLDSSDRVVGVLVGLPGLLSLTYAMRRLGQMLNEFQLGNIFAARTIGHVRAFAGATVITSLLTNLEKPLRNLVLNLLNYNGASYYRISLEVTSNELLLLLVCGLFYVVIGVMQEGRRLARENESFV